MRIVNKRRLLFPLQGVGGSLLFALLACTGHPKEVRLKGEFAHLDQGEFLIYSTDEALDRLDTLHIQDGRFSYKLPTIQPATLHILYPNQSELVVFATPGADILIKGDAQNLNEVEVSGSEENKCYTEFRKDINGKSATDTKIIAHDYILQHPTLAMSRYLLTTYFLCDESTSASEATELYDSLSRACPDDLTLSKLATHVRSIDKIRIGKPLPDFALTLSPDMEATVMRSKSSAATTTREKSCLLPFGQVGKAAVKAHSIGPVGCAVN